MLNIEIKEHPGGKGNECTVCIDGDTKTICLQTVAAINGVYMAILKQSTPEEVAKFKAAMLAAMMPGSPVWDGRAARDITEVVMMRKEGRRG